MSQNSSGESLSTTIIHALKAEKALLKDQCNKSGRGNWHSTRTKKWLKTGRLSCATDKQHKAFIPYSIYENDTTNLKCYHSQSKFSEISQLKNGIGEHFVRNEELRATKQLQTNFYIGLWLLVKVSYSNNRNNKNTMSYQGFVGVATIQVVTTMFVKTFFG